jgi:hypothetical protein
MRMTAATIFRGALGIRPSTLRRVHAAALDGRANQDGLDGLVWSQMRVGDDQLHPTNPRAFSPQERVEKALSSLSPRPTQSSRRPPTQTLVTITTAGVDPRDDPRGPSVQAGLHRSRPRPRITPAGRPAARNARLQVLGGGHQPSEPVAAAGLGALVGCGTDHGGQFRLDQGWGIVWVAWRKRSSTSAARSISRTSISADWPRPSRRCPSA